MEHIPHWDEHQAKNPSHDFCGVTENWMYKYHPPVCRPTYPVPKFASSPSHIVFGSTATSSAEDGEGGFDARVDSKESTRPTQKPSPKATTSEAVPKPIATSDFSVTTFSGAVTAFVCGLPLLVFGTVVSLVRIVSWHIISFNEW